MPLEAGQKKTVNVKWDAAEVGGPEDEIQLRVRDPKKDDKYVTVRLVDNDADESGKAAATITFPKRFQGTRHVMARGPYGEQEAEIEIK